MTIYDIPTIVRISLPQAIAPPNIMSGFTLSDIWPFDRNIFTELDFAPSYVTDRPELIMSEVNDNNTTQELAQPEPVQKTPSPTPGTSTHLILQEQLQDIRPFPKAPQKKLC